MKKIILILFIWNGLFAGEVDISFLVADIKYNEKQGVKICEVQQAAISLFKGFDYLYEGKGLIAANACHVLSHYHNNFWFIPRAINYYSSYSVFARNGWLHAVTMTNLLLNTRFVEKAIQPVEDPSSISDYHAVLYTREKFIPKFDAFKEKYPGVILIDEASWPYWTDKYKMSLLFTGHEQLEKVKPRWNLYPKKYDKNLAKEINAEIKSKMLVIKPRGSAEGRGVIVVKKENLDETLKYILTDTDKLKKNPDKAYNYWVKDRFDSFLVEEFVHSDPVRVPYFDNKPFNCTMRVVFLSIYDQGEFHLHFVGEYWIVPEKAVNEAGSLHDHHKASMTHPHISIVDPEVREEVKRQLEVPLRLMHMNMLGLDVTDVDTDSLDQGPVIHPIY